MGEHRPMANLTHQSLPTGATPMSSPSVSVCMPVYNTERYVAEAIESILAQTFTDFEFLIVDDGSTDGTLPILSRFAARDSRIRVISRPNTGIVGALNEMLGLARADLVARMDADDMALPDRFEIQVAYLRAHPDVVCVGGEVMAIDASGRDLYLLHEPMDHEAIQELALTGSCPLNHPSVMMRRAAVMAVGGYDPQMKHLEDLDLFLRLGEFGRLVNLPRTVLKYRVHPSSKCEAFILQQAEYLKLASDRACARRGIPPRYIEPALAAGQPAFPL